MVLRDVGPNYFRLPGLRSLFLLELNRHQKLSLMSFRLFSEVYDLKSTVAVEYACENVET